MLTIIVPYRDREEHLRQFIPHMNAYLPGNGKEIVVVEQTDDKPFNRGRLLNIGFLETNSPQYCFHDVDHLPINVSYARMRGVHQLASSDIQRKDFLGAVTMIDSDTFLKIGGYNNEYFHRAEDNELAFHLKRLGIYVYNRFSVFDILSHPRTSPEFIPELWRKAQIPRTINMLENCKYELISKEVYETHTHIKVAL